MDLTSKDDGKRKTGVQIPDYYTVVRIFKHPFFDPHILHLHDGNQKQKWSARPHRKGKSLGRKPLRREGKRVLLWQPYNISWWTAVLFTLGSMAWAVNGTILFGELIKNEKTSDYAVAYSGLVGGTLFLVGGWCMYLEALNMEHKLEFDEAVHNEERHFMYAIGGLFAPTWRKHEEEEHPPPGLTWRWCGWRGIRNISFIASFTQFLGTIIFPISVFAGLPGALPTEDSSTRGEWIGVFWVPQVVGGLFLTLSSYLLMIETQPNLWRIKPFNIGWHVGFWNVIGSLGFTLCGVFGIVYGPSQETQRRWASDFVSFLGSWSFLLGSILQYYEIIV